MINVARAMLLYIGSICIAQMVADRIENYVLRILVGAAVLMFLLWFVSSCLLE